MKVRMAIQGGPELAAALNALSKRISRKVQREALLFGGEPIRKDASVRAPRRSPAPDMADNIVMSSARGDASEAAVAIGPERRFKYAGFQEFGTSHHGAQPFMRPAFDAKGAQALQRITQELWRALAARGVSRSAVVDAPISAPAGGGLL